MNGRRRLLAIGTALIVGIVLLLVLRGALGAGASVVLAPVAAAESWFSRALADLTLRVRTEDALIDEIRRLEDALAEYEESILTRRALQAENELLREALGQAVPESISASVLTRSPAAPYDTLLVDKGARDGVVTGAPVYADQRRVIGVVRAVYPRSALVLLVSAPGAESAVYVHGPDVFATAEGLGGGGVRVTLPQDVPLARGDLVLVPAVRGVFGEVRAVERTEESPYQYGYVTAPTSLSALRTVSIARESVPSLTLEEARRAVDAATSTLFSIELESSEVSETP